MADKASESAENVYDKLRRILPNAAKPKLKLFMSADIVGSTAYKQPLSALDRPPNEDWAQYIQQFYDRMAVGLRDNFLTYSKSLQDLEFSQENTLKFLGERPVFWKTVGDEIIFWKLIEHEDQLWLMLHCWMRTIAEVRQWLYDRETGLDIKSSVWAAGFPVRNRAIIGREIKGSVEPIGIGENSIPDANFLYAKTALSESSENLSEDEPVARALILEKYYREPEWDAPVDFIGSGIDVGFRIASMATTRRMAISLDVAYLMALSVLTKADADGKRDGDGTDLDGLASKLFGGRNAFKAMVSDEIGKETPNFPLLSSSINPPKSPAFVNKLGVYYSGAEPLKGVLGGIDYPRFWINIEKAGSLDSMKTQLNDDFLNPLPWDRLLDFCRAFYDDRRNFVFAPFIKRDNVPLSKTELPDEKVKYDLRLQQSLHAIGLAPEPGTGRANREET